MNALSQKISSSESNFANGLQISGALVSPGGTGSIEFNYTSYGQILAFNESASFTPLALAGSEIDLNPNNEPGIKADHSTTAGDTRLLLWDVTAGSLRRVTIGANDSGGAGYRVLRIPN